MENPVCVSVSQSKHTVCVDGRGAGGVGSV